MPRNVRIRFARFMRIKCDMDFARVNADRYVRCLSTPRVNAAETPETERW
jgi:hypothetical protein